jgi:hypothetical protein
MAEPVEPSDDIDFITEEGSIGVPTGQSDIYSAGWLGHPTPVFVPKQSTPLANECDDETLPRFAAWSMKYLQRTHLFSRAEMEVRATFGEGLHTVYVMDDGRKHCLISRKVGSGTDGSTYCLVAQITVASYEALVDGASTQETFSKATGFSLCSVFEAEDDDAPSNVLVVETYRSVSDVPATYLPPHRPIKFDSGA